MRRTFRFWRRAAALCASRPWLKAVECAVLAVALCFSLGAGTPESRQNTLSHQLMCTCGCAQLLGECDHVGCPDRDKELSELTTDIAAGMTRSADFECVCRQVRRNGAGRADDQGIRPGGLDRALRGVRRGAAGNDPADPALGRIGT